ncbi:hypothetical protein [Gordonia sihwensis]
MAAMLRKLLGRDWATVRASRPVNEARVEDIKAQMRAMMEN